jgi:hypothetical protein
MSLFMITVYFYWYAVCGNIFWTWPNDRNVRHRDDWSNGTILPYIQSIVTNLIVVRIAYSRHAASPSKIVFKMSN